MSFIYNGQRIVEGDLPTFVIQYPADRLVGQEVRYRGVAVNDSGLFEANFGTFTIGTGDLDFDGVVDARDAGVMFSNWAQSGIGDLNLDGIVDAADAGEMFEYWTGDSGHPISVPEPTTQVLAMVALLMVVLRARY